MSDVVTRVTSRIVTLDEDVLPGVSSIRIPKRYSDRVFRPVLINEFLSEKSTNSTWQHPAYTVKVSGPIVTESGRDHASQSGERSWQGDDLVDAIGPDRNEALSPEQFPEALVDVLWGAETLRLWAETEAARR